MGELESLAVCTTHHRALNPPEEDKCRDLRYRQDLEKEYCPPLDAALVSAIATDYDTSDAAQTQQLRDTLEVLKLSALEQEDLPFDPSGTSGCGCGEQQQQPASDLTTTDEVEVVDGSISQNEVRSRGTDISSLTSELSVREKDSSSSSAASASAYIVGADGKVTLAGASLGVKIGYLVEMFPTVDRFTIEHSLKKSHGDVDRAMDVLLNLAFFDEQLLSDEEGKVLVPKGIDGFEDTAAHSKGRKGKSKKKNSSNKSAIKEPPAESYEPYGNSVNKWAASQKDVEFIHARTSAILKKETVASTYHANGASLPATIRSLAQTHAQASKTDATTTNNPVTATQISELTQEFPSIPAVTFAGLLHITRNSPSAANELAAALVTQPMAPSVSQLIQFTATPLHLDNDDEADTPRNKRYEPHTVQNYDRAQGSAGAHFVAGAEAFSKASMAYRRGRSDRLMGGAAAYYSVVGREHLERARRNAAAASDALVDAQSTADTLDLHGVSVQDAVRIASERVAEWWEALGEVKYMRGDGSKANYRIVTGVGRHSHDGTSRLGPAVFRRLVSDGWRVEVGDGVFTVTGVARR